MNYLFSTTKNPYEHFPSDSALWVQALYSTVTALASLMLDATVRMRTGVATFAEIGVSTP